MNRILLLPVLLLIAATATAGKLTGRITDNTGKALAFASISIKGTTKGTTANGSGVYSITVSPGTYTLVCQHVGYARVEKPIQVSATDQTVDFILNVQELTLQEVVVKQGGEDPAYEIIRQAIRKRDYYNDQVDSFSVNVYIKGLMRSGGMPQRIFGKKVERDASDGLDSAGKGILFLSESMTKVDYVKPNKIRYQVLSSRESGGGYGFSFPFFINFYQNNVSVFDNNLNPRGFISPVADGALNYYKYKYEGSFVDEGKMVNTIKVIPRRKNEPLFSGTIQITEDDWRIYSIDLVTSRDYQLELLDSLRITQLHQPVTGDVWRTQNQVLSLVFRQFGFHVSGNFVNVYTDYDINPGFAKKHFGRTIMKYDTAFNKKDSVYWSQVRPVALEDDEKRDFVFKDSLHNALRDTNRTRLQLDSLRRIKRPITVKGIFWSGQGRSFYGKKSTVGWRMKPLLPQLEYNTVEGVSVNLEQTFTLYKKGRYSYSLDWNTRYGFSNSHLNSWASLMIRPRKSGYRDRYLQLSGGKRISQFNHDDPINPLTNAAYTLLAKKNYMKLYENWFGSVTYNNKLENGLQLHANVTYEDRLPLSNTTDFSFFNKDRELLPNHPYELAALPFTRSQAVVAGVSVSWQPGIRYIEFPYSKMPIPSKAPVFTVSYSKGFRNILGSDVDFDKWQFSMADGMNFKIGGEFKYKIGVGGFINSKKVGLPDLQHFNGNQTFYNIKYLNSFQLAPYYRYSNAEPFYAFGHAEHHFNGLLTNKIPLLNKLKWHLVAGANTFLVDKNNYYLELFAGLENILKLFRVDVVNAFQPGIGNSWGVRVGFGGLIGGKVRFGQ